MKTLELKNKYVTSKSMSLDLVGGNVSVFISGNSSAGMTLDFENLEKVYFWLSKTIDEIRENCKMCGSHERDGCQIHG